MLTSRAQTVSDFEIFDPTINFSDHVPIGAAVACSIPPEGVKKLAAGKSLTPSQLYLRWDKADVNSYYLYTGHHLQPILHRLENTIMLCNAAASNCFSDSVDTFYNEVISVLNAGAKLFVPAHRKNFYKFWWNAELSMLKDAATESNRVWKAAGKPRHGPIFNKRQQCRAQYRKCIRDTEKSSTMVYTNDLHEALLAKDSQMFWKCWRSKFETRSKCGEVGGCIDHEAVANNFATYFSEVYAPNNHQRASALYDKYTHLRENYFGLPLAQDWAFDTELVSKCVANLKCGRAPDIVGLTAEHLLRAHPVLPVILSKLFQLIVLCKHVPTGFGKSYIVPIPKTKYCAGKTMNCEDFRGIAISPIISKLFEYCFIEKFGEFLSTDSKQFGFKKGVGCDHATVRHIVERLIKGGCTVNLCAIDLSKAFDKVNHHALFTKLMERNLPVPLLELLENWLYHCFSSVKWDQVFSEPFAVKFGVRQGSVLSPFLFAVYLDDIPVNRSLIRSSFVLLYADDILLIAPSIEELQRVFAACEGELNLLDMCINVKKSCCLRIGPRYDSKGASVTTMSGYSLPWINEIRYLGTYIINGRQFCCSLSHAKRSFHRSVNAVFGKVGRLASEEVILQLVRSKCIPVLLYGLECCPLSKSDKKSLDFCVTRFLMKLFKSSNNKLITECRSYFNFQLPSELLDIAEVKFVNKYKSRLNLLQYFGIVMP